MDFDQTIRDIRKLFTIVSDGKEADVHLSFKGNSHGVTKPWVIKIDTKEALHETHEGAANELLSILKLELSKKISDLRAQVSRYEKSLGSFNN